MANLRNAHLAHIRDLSFSSRALPLIFIVITLLASFFSQFPSIDPFSVGRADLDPLSAGMGGGMFMDPQRSGTIICSWILINVPSLSML